MLEISSRLNSLKTNEKKKKTNKPTYINILRRLAKKKNHVVAIDDSKQGYETKQAIELLNLPPLRQTLKQVNEECEKEW